MPEEAAPDPDSPADDGSSPTPEGDEEPDGPSRGLLEQMDDLMAALNADLTRLDEDLQSTLEQDGLEQGGLELLGAGEVGDEGDTTGTEAEAETSGAWQKAQPEADTAAGSDDAVSTGGALPAQSASPDGEAQDAATGDTPG